MPSQLPEVSQDSVVGKRTVEGVRIVDREQGNPGMMEEIKT